MAVSSGELEVGTHCIAMPVFADGKILAAIEVQVGDPQSDLVKVSPALARWRVEDCPASSAQQRRDANPAVSRSGPRNGCARRSGSAAAICAG